MRADEIEEQKEEEKKKKRAAPKAPLTHGQFIRKEELLAQKNGFSEKFRAVKKEIKERKDVVATIAEAMGGGGEGGEGVREEEEGPREGVC
ncbi:hypothetical protein VE02_01012 [Pseudogymnoascus sp. 03VT05]|nr:hypothetical protein VE02_01012 [Pseudogymnoascus sp. 03VT05]